MNRRTLELKPYPGLAELEVLRLPNTTTDRATIAGRIRSRLGRIRGGATQRGRGVPASRSTRITLPLMILAIRAGS